MTKKIKTLIIVLSIIIPIVAVSVALPFILKKNPPKQKKESTIEVSVEEKDYFAGNKLSSVSLKLNNANNFTKGKIAWVDENQLLILGENEYSWKFVPNDKENFKEKIGKIKVNAKEKTLESIEIKTKPTKLSGYYAFEEFDISGMVLNAKYNNGDIEDVSTKCEIVYQSIGIDGNHYDSLRAGDTKVTIKYKTFSKEINIEKVSKVQVEKPAIIGEYTYNKSEQTIKITKSDLFEAYNNKFTNAGQKQIDVKLKDEDNYEWKDSNSSSPIKLPVEIKKAQQTVIENNFVGNFDGKEHKASVESSDSINTIYYSDSKLTSENYATGVISPIGWTEIVASKKVYYYILGNQNYLDKSGELTITINKGIPTITSEEIFAIHSGKPVELVDSIVKVTGINKEVVNSSGKIKFTYFKSYTSKTENEKTTKANSGANGEGLAPVNKGTYYFVATFLGDEKYQKYSSSAIKFVIGDEPKGFYQQPNEKEFIWTNEFGNAIFKSEIVSQNLKLFRVDSEVFGNGRIIIQEDKFVLNSSNGQTYFIELSADGNSLTLTNKNNTEETINFDRFGEPAIVGKYQYDTFGDGIDFSTMNIYWENGQVKFDYLGYVPDAADPMKSKEVKKSGIVIPKGGNWNNVDFKVDMGTSFETRFFHGVYDSNTKSLTLDGNTDYELDGKYELV